ncbi:MAG: hypothetical protein R3325_14375 [Thermoanaerobaculia bacterium]|nr:hypothetical protein [Thermoanaerobaculia bacterium]
MSNDTHDPRGPAEGRELAALPLELDPPPGLEDRVAGSLAARGLLPGADRRRPGLPPLRAALAAAASLALLALGFVAGRALAPRPAASAVPAGEPTRYALLLYETASYDPPQGREAVERYHEYSRWVGQARERGQFVGGEELSVERGWVIPPASSTPRPGLAPEGSARLSGVFLITARDDAHALDLAASLPHLRHGGHVVVQEVVPTDRPPRVEGEAPAG